MKRLSESAPAKINLFLRVTGRRADGYHQLDSVFLPITLTDRVALEMRDASTAKVAIRCNVAALANESNLAVRAARAFLDEYAIAAEVWIDLEKNVPSGAGLGGGSSDAAVVLRMMATLNEIAIDDRLRRVALELGADVPFFIDPTPSRVRGIGELIEPIAVPRLALVLAFPTVEVPTAATYRELRREQWSGAAPDSDLESIAQGRITQSIVVNDLAAPAIAMYPEIGSLCSTMADLGASAVQMSGSGGSVFAVFATIDEAKRAGAELTRRAPMARVVTCETLPSVDIGKPPH